MLSRPDSGWTVFQPGSENTACRLSYLTDVAVEWLDRAIRGLETLDVFSVHGFCEPGRMVCTVSFWNCYIILEGDGRDDNCESVYTVHISMIDFCRKLHDDIAGSLEAWVHWDDDSIEAPDDSEEAFDRATSERRNAIRERLDRLGDLISRVSEDFEDGCFI